MKQTYQHVLEHSANTCGKYKLKASDLVKLGQISETRSKSALKMAGVRVRSHPGRKNEGRLLKSLVLGYFPY